MMSLGTGPALTLAAQQHTGGADREAAGAPTLTSHDRPVMDW